MSVEVPITSEVPSLFFLWYKFIKYTYHNQTDLFYIVNVYKIQFENKSQDDRRCTVYGLCFG